MIYGIGVDLCSIGRINRLLNKESFVRKFFSETEQDYLSGKKNTFDQTVAGLFAAKEAFAKVFGTGFVNMDLASIEVLHNENGKPYYNPKNWAKEVINQKNISNVFLTISHDGGIAIAYAVAEIKSG